MSNLEPHDVGTYTVRPRGITWVLATVRLNDAGEPYESALGVFRTHETANEAKNWLEGTAAAP